MNQQEQLWQGQFGTEYIARNRGAQIKASALGFIARCLAKAPGVRSIVEFGANIGINLDALRHLYPEATQTAIEINPDACKFLRKDAKREVHQCSMFDFNPNGRLWDMVLVKGLLIHVPPDDIPKAYQMIDKCARRYALVCEYFNPTPVAVHYRGHDLALWKRDFAAEIIDACDGWECIEYGFVWERDPMPQDNINWWLLERR